MHSITKKKQYLFFFTCDHMNQFPMNEQEKDGICQIFHLRTKENTSAMEKLLWIRFGKKNKMAFSLHPRSSIFTIPATLAKVLDHLFKGPRRLASRISEFQLRPFNTHHLFNNHLWSAYFGLMTILEASTYIMSFILVAIHILQGCRKPRLSHTLNFTYFLPIHCDVVRARWSSLLFSKKNKAR